MAYPTGSGSERIQRGYIHNQINTATSFRFDGGVSATGTSSYDVPDHHIITILSIIICDQSGTNKNFHMWIDGDSLTDVRILQSNTVPAYGTFVWSDKFVLHTNDKLVINADASSNFDVLYTYVDQNWE